MPEISFALLLLAAVVAVYNWRRGLLLTVLIALLQDPLRKLAPGEPAYFVLFAGVVFGAAWVGALLSHVRLGPGVIQGWRKHVGTPFALFVVLLLLQAVHSFVRWGSPAMTGIGLMSYLLPIPAVVLAYQFAVRGGVVHIRQLMWFYVVLAAVWLPSIYLEYAGLQWPVLGELGEGLIIYDVSTVLKAYSGLFRSSEIASWHTATTACFLFLLFLGRKLSLPKMFLLVGLVAALAGLGILTGRRKMLVQVVIFASVYLFLFAWFLRSKSRVAIVVALAGLIGYTAVVGIMDPNAGEKAFDSHTQQVREDELYRAYVIRGRTAFGDVAERFRQLGVAPVTWAVQGYGVFGAGLGTGSQGVQHVAASESINRGAAEGGLGKITMELGVPGLVLALWLLFSFVRYVWRLLRELSRTSPAHARFAFGLVAFLAANAASFSVATQAYGDLFILMTMGWTIGFLLAMPVLAGGGPSTVTRHRTLMPRVRPATIRASVEPLIAARTQKSGSSRLCVLTTHPIQYMAPWFRELAKDPEVELDVIFLRELNAAQQGVGFGQAFQWDVPLRLGYSSRILGVAAGIGGIPALWWRLFRAVREIRPHAVMITGWNEPALVAAYPLMKLLGVPVILRGESNSLRPRSLRIRMLHRALLRFVSAIVVIGKANREFYLDNGVPAERLFQGAYFVESERMLAMAQNNAPIRTHLRHQFGFAKEDFVFTFVGKHVPFKRPMLMVEAAAIARRRGLPVKLLFAGSGELTESLTRRAKELGVPVHFTGFLNQTEMWKAYVPADAFVLPSTNGETWGLVTNEAMLFGLPVIVSDQVGCGPDLVIEGVTGHVFSNGAEGLAGAMEKLVRNRDRAPTMGAVGRKRVLEKYSMPVATKGLKAALKAVRGRRR